MEICKQSMQWRPSQRAQLLAPFDHQVAGQSSMLVYDATTLCKPLIPREHFVYQTLPVELQEFTPQYRGEILVKLQEKEGHIQLVGHAVGAAEIGHQTCPCSTEGEPDTKTKDCGSSSGVSSGQRNSFSSDASQAHESSEASAAASYMYLAHEGVDPCATSVSTMSSAASHLHPQTHNLNPWSMKNHKRLLEKMRKSSHRNNKTRFMLLGNVVAGFKKPCILDLKIGSRLHGDDASSTKVASQTAKCSRTTSSSLGVRLCGMQVYQVTAGKYVNLDKYHGRTLTDETFQQTLRDFLHNGVWFRQELLQPIISRLAALISCVRRLDTYRFYASSLLIMYDGEVEQDLTAFSQLDNFQHLKHNPHSNKQRARGQELRNRCEDGTLSDIDTEPADSKPRRVRSADQICVQLSKHQSVSVAASPSIQSIYDSTSIPSVPVYSKIPQVPCPDSCTIPNNVAALEQNQPVSPKCQTESSDTTQTICVPEAAADCLDKLTLSHSGKQLGCLSVGDTRENCTSIHGPEGHENPFPVRSSQKHVNNYNSSHSCQTPSFQEKLQEYNKAPCSTDHVVKRNEFGSVSSSGSSGQDYGDKSSGFFNGPDSLSVNPCMKSSEDKSPGHNLSNDFHTSPDFHSGKATHNDSSQLPEVSTISYKATEQHLMLGKAGESIGRLKVDVKMIDFAHTTHSGFEADKKKHIGPDHDYITGLEKLKSLFECLCSHEDFG